jgi:chromate transporter
VVVFRALEGINAVVVGFMWAAALYLLKDIHLSVELPDIIAVLTIPLTFIVLKFSRIPAPFLVIGCLLLGWIF